ncbi:glycoside hydrolase family 19 protein [Enterobacter sp. P82]|uniref:glycoside hydrolase family 19 protein n=1 Tax=Enterobacter sp. P82 TaxID=3123033 RepID=UPI00300CBD6B
MWDVQKAVQHLNEHAEASSKGYCARYVKAAISAGGDISSWPSIVSAKDYGPALIERGFNVIPATDSFVAGDVVIIQGFNKADFPEGEIKKDHPHGHMAMFNGQQWVSDFKQNSGYYPGGDYRKAKPTFVFYRYKDVDAQLSGQSAADNKPMKTCFPSCKQDGKQYATLDEMMGLIGREPHGSWLAGTNHMWHGGIHLTEISAPGSVLKPDSMDSVVPLQCMADGEVVAWRLNQDYKTDTYNSQALQYSTTFVLVKSLCKPGPEKENTWLEFYTLYMGLAPLSEFPQIPCYKVTDKGDGLRKRQYSGTELEGHKAPASDDGKLKKGTRVAVTKQTSFELDRKLQPFGLAKVLNGKGEPTGKPFWVSLDPSYMEPEGTQRALLPAWMQQAVAKGVFDSVTKPNAILKINAGDAIGFLGDDIVPVGMGRVSGSKYVHIEVLSADSRMPAFLDNPGAVTSGRKYIRIKPDSKLYTNSGSTFTQTPSVVGKDVHAVLPEDKCNPKDSGGKKYYQISEHGWLSQDDVEEVNQYDLKKLGFSAFVQESTPDMSKSLTEKWVQSTFEAYSEQVVPERGIQQQQMSDFYKAMADKLDSDQDDELSGAELYNAVHHAEIGIRDIAARMTVKHVSEWFGGSSDPKWVKFFETYDPIRIGFTKKWLDDVEWMSQVEPFTSGKAVWHMHPVVFLDAVGVSDGVTYAQLKTIFPQASDADLNTVVVELQGRLEEFKLDTPTRLRHFFSQIKGEVGPKMEGLTEKFQFSPAALKSFSKYYRQHPSEADTDGYERNAAGKISRGADEQAIGRKHYLRLNGNRQSNPDDGYNFRGRGLIQITGYEKYHGFMIDYSEHWQGPSPDTVTDPDEVNEMPYAIRSALWFWIKYKPYNADKGRGYDDVADVTSVVNGGDMGLAERQAAYKICEKVFL